MFRLLEFASTYIACTVASGCLLIITEFQFRASGVVYCYS